MDEGLAGAGGFFDSILRRLYGVEEAARMGCLIIAGGHTQRDKNYEHLLER
jgi:hypothetical protein